MLPKISIVTPVLNAEITLEKMILSILEQNYPRYELIILDGGSSDTTLGIIKKYSQYITYWHSKVDGNPTIAINEGIKKASGDLINLLMADDFYSNNILHAIAIAWRENPDADMITCAGRLVKHNKQGQLRILQQYDCKKQMQLSIRNICYGHSAICCRFISKKIYQQLGSYLVADDKGKHIYSADKELLLRFYFNHIKDIFIPVIGHNYLAHPKSSTFSGNRNMTVRLYEEHMVWTKSFLTQQMLKPNEKRALINWYCHQSTRLVIYNLIKGKFSKAFKVLSESIKPFLLLWIVHLIRAPFEFGLRRFLRFCIRVTG